MKYFTAALSSDDIPLATFLNLKADTIVVITKYLSEDSGFILGFKNEVVQTLVA